jgi:hypothetical protein
MSYTVQLVSESGSFAAPYGDDVEHCNSLKELDALLDYWEGQHDRVGSDSTAASLLVWKGKLEDVTDAYPDFEVKRGKRGGLVKSPC